MTSIAPTPRRTTSSAYMIGVLGVVSTICGMVIVGAYSLTLPAIQRNLAQITRDAVFDVLPQAKSQVIFEIEASGDLKAVSSPEGPLPKLYAGYDDAGKLVGVACEGAGQGYGGTVRALYAYSFERNAIVGFKVLESNETPGLGDKVAKDPGFLGNFADLDARLNDDGSGLAHPIEAVKHGNKKDSWQIDGISGATISSRAVGRLLNASANERLPVLARYRAQLEKGN